MAESSSLSGGYRIPPLKGAENYCMWRIQMQDILRDQGLWGYVDGSLPCPEGNAIAGSIWGQADQKALTIIRLRLSAEMMTWVVWSTSARHAWLALEKVFVARRPMAKVTARRKFLRYQIEEGADMDEEVRKMRKLGEDLIMMEADVSDEDFALTLLTALPSSWDPFVSSVGAFTDSSDLIGRILIEEARRKDRTVTETSLAATNGNRATGKKGGRSKFQKGVFCHHCHKEGHIRPLVRRPQEARLDLDWIASQSLGSATRARTTNNCSVRFLRYRRSGAGVRTA
ncbi:hypothetical protein NM688_g4592 [Phlebia brevispora]|uniref:Uncharacterized protein n=1 Tax=Phlebia brevispora TaxID=194682 RepID=A0ACC1T276_9APHY|nr:hypothetical protein NM688_g4592 [Phlebia brevispora]